MRKKQLNPVDTSFLWQKKLHTIRQNLEMVELVLCVLAYAID
jgi:hypothetical protein